MNRAEAQMAWDAAWDASAHFAKKATEVYISPPKRAVFDAWYDSLHPDSMVVWVGPTPEKADAPTTQD